MKKYKVPYMPERPTSKQKKEYFERTPVVLKDVNSLRRETGIVIRYHGNTSFRSRSRYHSDFDGGTAQVLFRYHLWYG